FPEVAASNRIVPVENDDAVVLIAAVPSASRARMCPVMYGNVQLATPACAVNVVFVPAVNVPCTSAGHEVPAVQLELVIVASVGAERDCSMQVIASLDMFAICLS